MNQSLRSQLEELRNHIELAEASLTDAKALVASASAALENITKPTLLKPDYSFDYAWNGSNEQTLTVLHTTVSGREHVHSTTDYNLILEFLTDLPSINDDAALDQYLYNWFYRL